MLRNHQRFVITLNLSVRQMLDQAQVTYAVEQLVLALPGFDDQLDAAAWEVRLEPHGNVGGIGAVD